MIYLRKETPLGYLYGKLGDLTISMASPSSVNVSVGIIWGMFDGDDFIIIPEIGPTYYTVDDGQMNAHSEFATEEVISEAGQLTLSHQPMGEPNIKNTVTGETYLLEELGFEEGNAVITINGLVAGQLCIVSYRHQPIVYTMVNQFPQRLRYRRGGGQGSVEFPQRIFEILIEYGLIEEASILEV